MRTRVSIAGAVCGAVLVGACATSPYAQRTDRVQVSELTGSWGEIARSLADSAFLSARGKDAPAIVLVAEPAKNLTMDRLSPADRAIIVDRLLFDPLVFSMLTERNVAVQVPPGEYAQIQKYLRTAHTIDFAHRPTHALNTTLQSVTRAGVDERGLANDRSDLVSLSFSITDLRTGEIVWAGRHELTRVRAGRVVD